jgi:hypothetical protein
MSKQEMLIEYNIQEIIDYISNDKDIDYDEAMHQFYSSKVFEKLNDIDTGLYLESPAYVYDLFKSETDLGKIVQAEI